MKPELSIVMPFYNEECALPTFVELVLKILRERNINFELVLVNNGSHDKTPEMLKKLAKINKEIKVVHVEKNQGYGFGVISGLKQAEGFYVGYTDGDGQVPASEIITVFDEIKKSGCDLCKGKRRIRGDGLKRILASISYNLLLNLIFLMKFEDINAKPKIIKRAYFEKMNISSKDWFIDSEILISARRLGCKIREVDVNFVKRKTGKSNVRLEVVLEFLKNVISARLK